MRHKGTFEATVDPRITDRQSLRIDRARAERAFRFSDLVMASRVVAEDHVDSGWFCLSVWPNHEFSVEENLEREGVHALVPRCKAMPRKHRGRIIEAELPVLCGYVLVRVAPLVQAFRALLRVDDVNGLLGNMESPWRLRDRDVEKFSACAAKGDYDHRIVEAQQLNVKRGDRVRISDGPFTGWIAEVIGVDNLKLGRVVVALELFGKPISPELDIAQIEKL